MLPFKIRIVLLSLFCLSLASCSIFRPAATLPDQSNGPADSKEMQPYDEVITDEARTLEGVVDVHYVDEDIYYEIPDSLLGRDFLSVSRVAKVPTDFIGFYSGGTKTAEQVLIFEKAKDRILLRRQSYEQVAADSLPIAQSVRANNFQPIIAGFEIEAKNDAEQSYVFRVNELFLDDIPAFSGLSSGLRSNYEVSRLDASRSYIDTVKTYPQNVEVRHVMTYEASNPPSSHGANTISLLMNQSMILLPKEPMRPRLADYRVGWFTVDQVDFGLDEQKAGRRSYIRRWRLEPSDMEAYNNGELVEPKEPIVYYIDPATPEEYRDYVKKGVEDWNTAFEVAGFKNAIEARMPPSEEEDPDFTPEDIRYNMVRWVANLTRNAMGPSTTDPRTGEIIASDIVWWHNHIRSYRNRLMIETGAANPKAQNLRVDDEYLGEAIRQVIAHEIGHALGLPHNMKANSAYPVDSLRSPDFTEEYGVSASVMDYARQNYIAQPGDGVERFIRKIGPYDTYAINWGYRLIPGAPTPEAEKETLDEWILEKADDPMYRFGTSTGYDPSAQTEALSDDNVAASTYGMQNLRRIVPNLIEWTSTPGEGYEDLEEIYDELIFQWSRYLGHVVTNIGGVYMERKSTDQEGEIYGSVPVSVQRKAMQFMNKHAFSTPEWLLDAEILRRIEHSGAMDRVRSLQGSHLRSILSTARMNRLAEAEAFGEETYTLAEMLEDLRSGVWSELEDAEEIDLYRRNLQRIYLSQVESMLNSGEGEESETPFGGAEALSASDIRAMLRYELRELQEDVDEAKEAVSDHITAIHLEDLSVRIGEMLEI